METITVDYQRTEVHVHSPFYINGLIKKLQLRFHYDLILKTLKENQRAGNIMEVNLQLSVLKHESEESGSKLERKAYFRGGEGFSFEKEEEEEESTDTLSPHRSRSPMMHISLCRVKPIETTHLMLRFYQPASTEEEELVQSGRVKFKTTIQIISKAGDVKEHTFIVALCFKVYLTKLLLYPESFNIRTRSRSRRGVRESIIISNAATCKVNFRVYARRTTSSKLLVLPMFDPETSSMLDLERVLSLPPHASKLYLVALSKVLFRHSRFELVVKNLHTDEESVSVICHDVTYKPPQLEVYAADSATNGEHDLSKASNNSGPGGVLNFEACMPRERIDRKLCIKNVTDSDIGIKIGHSLYGTNTSHVDFYLCSEKGSASSMPLQMLSITGNSKRKTSSFSEQLESESLQQMRATFQVEKESRKRVMASSLSSSLDSDCILGTISAVASTSQEPLVSKLTQSVKIPAGQVVQIRVTFSSSKLSMPKL